MLIRDLFASDVTRDIPPVVYFHEQDPEKLASEVDEYIITGGWPESDPRHKRVPNGIHEQYVRLLRSIARENAKKGGPELPASWISGFYGSGKSIFAKMLGLSLDGIALPNGNPLHKALLARDTSPKHDELNEAWTALTSTIEAVSVVFDIGGASRDNEHIHSAVVRQVQQKLGYCREPLVADYEQRLEKDGHWPRFEELAQQALGRPWSEAKDRAMAEEDFSLVLSKLFPENYPEPFTWIDIRAGQSTLALSVDEATTAIQHMMDHRRSGKTLFIVIDEVSQYIFQDDKRMLALQSFVSSLGQRLKGRAWLLVTGQEKLEDESAANVLGKMKDRFPPRLRVHLEATNIRDVVHKRLLHKAPAREGELRAAFQKHRHDLSLFAFACESITEEDFVEVYPMLPGHIDLILQITSALRTRSTRAQGDDHQIRGLLQMLGELFREQKLVDKELGALVTLDQIFDVQQTALDVDIRSSLNRIFKYCDKENDALAQRAAKAVALLQLVNETYATTHKLVSQCIYDRLDRGSQESDVRDALERLRQNNFLGYSEKLGYKIQSSAAQEWESERRGIGVTSDQRSARVQAALKTLLAEPEQPRLEGRPFPIKAYFTDSGRTDNAVIEDRRDPASVAIDFRFVNLSDQDANAWVKRSDETAFKDKLIWVCGDPRHVLDLAGQLAKSEAMVAKYKPRRATLSRERQPLLFEEEARVDELKSAVRGATAETWMSGSMYFRAQSIDPRDKGPVFPSALNSAATFVLPDLFPRFTNVQVTPGELLQLIGTELSGVSPKFLPDGLGILELDAGRYAATCAGKVPARILQEIEAQKGMGGNTLLAHFGKPPYGYTSTVVRACLAGLLRASKIRIQPEHGLEITSVKDVGVRDLFDKERGLLKANVFPAGESEIKLKDKVRICKFFEDHFSKALNRENDEIADAVFNLFPEVQDRLRSVEARLNRVASAPPTPEVLVKLSKAFENCRRSRQVEPTVLAVKRNLDKLKDGLQLLGIYDSELTDDAIASVKKLHDVAQYQLVQLRDAAALDAEIDTAGQRIEEHLRSDRPWRDAASLESDAATISAAYLAERRKLLSEQTAAVDAARLQIESREGFSDLTSEEADHVRRPLTQAATVTSEDAIAPPLTKLSDGFATTLAHAVADANRRLDELINVAVVKVQFDLRGYEIKDERDLETLITELRDRVQPALKDRARVRFE